MWWNLFLWRVGKTGRGTPEHHDVMDRVDIVNSTLGKALGGASGGFTTGKKEIVELLRQRSRPYLFSNTVCAPLCSSHWMSALRSHFIAASTCNSWCLAGGVRHANRKHRTPWSVTLRCCCSCSICSVSCRLEENTKHFRTEMARTGFDVMGMDHPITPILLKDARTLLSTLCWW